MSRRRAFLQQGAPNCLASLASLEGTQAESDTLVRVSSSFPPDVFERSWRCEACRRREASFTSPAA